MVWTSRWQSVPEGSGDGDRKEGDRKGESELDAEGIRRMVGGFQ